MGVGRPCKLTPEVADRLVELVEGGVPQVHAARLAGISHATLYNWLDEGSKQESGEFRDLFDRIMEARSKLCKQAVDVPVALLKDGDPKVRLNAAKFILTHQFSSEFRTRTETTGPEGAPVAVAVTGKLAVALFTDEQLRDMTPEQMAAAIDALGTKLEPEER